MNILNRHLSKVTVMLPLLYFFMNTSVHAQVCGGSTYTISIYTLMGAKSEDISYELFELNQDSVAAARKATPNGSYKSIPIYIKDYYNHEYGNFLYVNNVQDILLADSLRYPHGKSFTEFLNEEKVAKTGVIKNATLEFPTSETYYKLYLLKIYTKNSTVYIIANFFGGCKAGCGIIWSNYPKVINAYW